MQWRQLIACIHKHYFAQTKQLINSLCILDNPQIIHGVFIHLSHSKWYVCCSQLIRLKLIWTFCQNICCPWFCSIFLILLYLVIYQNWKKSNLIKFWNWRMFPPNEHEHTILFMKNLKTIPPKNGPINFKIHYSFARNLYVTGRFYMVKKFTNFPLL